MNRSTRRHILIAATAIALLAVGVITLTPAQAQQDNALSSVEEAVRKMATSQRNPPPLPKIVIPSVNIYRPSVTPSASSAYEAPELRQHCIDLFTGPVCFLAY